MISSSNICIVPVETDNWKQKSENSGRDMKCCKYLESNRVSVVFKDWITSQIHYQRTPYALHQLILFNWSQSPGAFNNCCTLCIASTSWIWARDLLVMPIFLLRLNHCGRSVAFGGFDKSVETDYNWYQVHSEWDLNRCVWFAPAFHYRIYVDKWSYNHQDIVQMVLVVEQKTPDFLKKSTYIFYEEYYKLSPESHTFFLLISHLIRWRFTWLCLRTT